jgi:hypothetical protein
MQSKGCILKYCPSSPSSYSISRIYKSVSLVSRVTQSLESFMKKSFQVNIASLKKCLREGLTGLWFCVWVASIYFTALLECSEESLDATRYNF